MVRAADLTLPRHDHGAPVGRRIRRRFAESTGTVRILLAEDNAVLRHALVVGLREAGYVVHSCDNGEDAWIAAATLPFDLAILDVNLPSMSGFDVCRNIRASVDPGPAVLFLTARDAIEDRVRGLDLGAEDYLVKPFAFAELLARVRALLRRGPGAPATIHLGPIVIDPARHLVSVGDNVVNLTAREFALLEYFARNAGLVMTKSMILDHVWEVDDDSTSNVIEVHVYAIRKKLEAAGAPGAIQTLRGVGYRFHVPTPS